MSEQKLNKKLSSIIHEYFDSDPHTLTKTNILKIYNDPKININFENYYSTVLMPVIEVMAIVRSIGYFKKKQKENVSRIKLEEERKEYHKKQKDIKKKNAEIIKNT